MAIPSRHKSRRFNALPAEATQQILAFRLRHESFALPIDAVQKLLVLENVYGDLHSTGVSLTSYQDKELLVVDVGRRIFREAEHKDIIPQRYLLIVQNSQAELVGLVIDSLPKLRRVTKSAFVPLPLAYISETNIQCISSLMIQIKDEPPIFMLNPDQLLLTSSPSP